MVDKEKIIKICKESLSMAEASRKLGMTYKRLIYYAKKFNCYYPNMSGKGLKKKMPKRKLEDVLIEGSSYKRSNLKKRLILEKILENKCSICDLSPKWHKKSLIMVLDHINGINNDNRLENLRLLCPNCNSQTDTFCRRKKPYKLNYKKEEIVLFKRAIEQEIKNCKICDKELNMDKKQKKYCSHECANISNMKVKRPPIEQLKEEIKNSSYCAVGRKYNVSDNAIRKWLKNENKGF